MKHRPTRDAEALEAGYNWRHRAYELCGMAVAAGLAIWLGARLATTAAPSWFLWPLSAFAGILIADFISGFVHWMFDTWWSVDTPVIGQLAVRTFRHHHVDPKAMTKHDFVETNGHNWALTPIYTGIGLAFCDAAETSLVDVFLGQTFLVGTGFVMVTSQFHKWAHADDVPRWVRFLQWSGIALPPQHHRTHHTAPYDRYYCVTNGWMNRPLQIVGFFRALERVVTWTTGAIPRRDDLGDAAALVAAERAGAGDEAPDPAPGRLAPGADPR
jgi:ubiquitin-conjugating enzyme E2 variant